MGLESATFISQLDNSFPLGGDPINKGDDHIRLVKSVLQSQFPNFTAAAANATIAEMNFLVGVIGAIIDTNGGQTIADLIITNDFTTNGELILNAGYSEDEDSYSVSAGTKSLDLAVATYWRPSSAMTAVAVDFTFDNPAASGRVTSFTMELNNMAANTDATPWPLNVQWALGVEPEWTSGIDFVTFLTRDGGTTWYGFAAGLDFS